MVMVKLNSRGGLRPKARALMFKDRPTVTDLVKGSRGPGGKVADVVPKVTVAKDLKRMAEALPAPPTGGRGRPKKNAQPLTRQQRRYRERMLAKAAEAWDKVTDGTGVLQVDGKEVSKDLT